MEIKEDRNGFQTVPVDTTRNKFIMEVVWIRAGRQKASCVVTTLLPKLSHDTWIAGLFSLVFPCLFQIFSFHTPHSPIVKA